MSSQKVSIIVPVYNCENTIEKCLLSLINQTYKNKEIIVVDDCSTDHTPEILRRMTEKYGIKVIRLPRNSGEGLLFSVGNSKALAETLIQVLTDKELASKLAHNARESVKNLKLESIVKLYLKAFFESLKS